METCRAPSSTETTPAQDDKSLEILRQLSDYNQRYNMTDFEIKVGHDTFTIIRYLGSGAEGISYLANDSHGHEVAIKALLKEENTAASFKNEVYALEKLGRLISKDEDQLIIVQTYIEGLHFNNVLSDYSSEKAGSNDYPSNHQAQHLKQKYFEILYKFRNATDMAHNDFRPYNIIGDEAIDFSRSEILSTDPLERKNELLYDDRNAADEWDWFYTDKDFEAIQENPFLPNALHVAYTIWDKYLVRYSGYLEQTKKYRLAWMTVLHYILQTGDTDSMHFPEESEFYS